MEAIRSESTRPPLPPFTAERARVKVRLAEDAWNSRDPDRVVGVYTADTRWRNRAEFPVGHEQVCEFLRADRLFRGPLGRRPDGHPSLSELGL